MDDLFESAWLKWAWGVVQAKTLNEEIDSLAEELKTDTGFRFRTQYEPKRHCISLRATSIPPLPHDLGLRLGDIAHCYRSCLDHVAWAVVQRGQMPPSVLTEWEQAGVYFPISVTRRGFNASLQAIYRGRGRKRRLAGRAKLPGVKRSDAAIIRRFQPYHTGKRAELHPLRLLDSLSNEDKHRTIRPLLLVPEGGKIEVAEPQDCEITRIPGRGHTVPLEVGVELHRVFVRKTGPHPDLKAHLQLSFQPALNPATPVSVWLSTTTHQIHVLLSAFGEPSQELMAAVARFL